MPADELTVETVPKVSASPRSTDKRERACVYREWARDNRCGSTRS